MASRWASIICRISRASSGNDSGFRRRNTARQCPYPQDRIYADLKLVPFHFEWWKTKCVYWRGDLRNDTVLASVVDIMKSELYLFQYMCYRGESCDGQNGLLGVISRPRVFSSSKGCRV